MLLFITIFIVTACSQNQNESTDLTQMKSNQMSKEDSLVVEENKSLQPQLNVDLSSADERKVMYQANISIEISDYDLTINKIQNEAKELGGYMIQSNITEMDQKIEGFLSFRIPQEQFQSFLQTIKQHSNQVKSEQISGNDVTEEYVDLQSRLKSKEVVENRLVEFMKSAEKTEDLLKISNELERVQAEIEEIKGRLKYLENKTDLATVDVYWIEEKVHVPNISNNLNTIEKTKKQLLTSINWILKGISWGFVVLIGNLPIFLIIGVLFLIFWKGRKKFIQFTKKSSKNTED